MKHNYGETPRDRRPDIRDRQSSKSKNTACPARGPCSAMCALYPWQSPWQRVQESPSRSANALHNRPVKSAVESPGGLSPPGAPRSVREPLDSYGSRCSAVSMTELPVGEECWIYAA